MNGAKSGATSAQLRVAAVIPAAGRGKRMGGETAKQFLLLAGKPVLVQTLLAFEAASSITQVILVVAQEQVEATRHQVVERYGLTKVTQVVAGGAERQHSVFRGLEAAGTGVDLVAVHDAARPLITPEQIDAAVTEAARTGALVVASPVKDTVKRVDASGMIVETPDRSSLWAAQTPQIFPYALLMKAYQEAFAEGFLGTDDASLVERLGEAVRVFEGSAENIKITTPEDLFLAERILERRGQSSGSGEAGGRG